MAGMGEDVHAATADGNRQGIRHIRHLYLNRGQLIGSQS